VTIGGVPRQWNFLLAAVSFPIIGIDFLRCHGLLVDVAKGEASVLIHQINNSPGQSKEFRR
jgi:hypothetical protein